VPNSTTAAYGSLDNLTKVPSFVPIYGYGGSP
jgi:hypothetical protein